MTPIYQVKVLQPTGDEEIADITELLKTHLVQMVIKSNITDQANTFEISMSDSSNQLKMPPTNAKVTISLGYLETGGAKDMGSFSLDETGLKGPPDTLYFSGSDKGSHKMGLKDENYWESATVLQIVQDIAEKTETEAVVADEFKDTTLDHVVQKSEAYSAFLFRLASQVGGYYTSNGDKICILAIDTGSTADGEPLKVIRLSLNQLTNWDYSVLEKMNYQYVQTRWKTFQNIVHAYYPPLSEKDRAQVESQKNLADGGIRIYPAEQNYDSSESALKAAESIYASLAHQREQLSVSCTGNPRLKPGWTVQFTDGRSELRGQDNNKIWIINDVSHSLSAKGYQTQCSLWTPYQAEPENAGE